MADRPAGKIRSFIAVDLDAPVRAALARVLDELRVLKCDVRWVRAEAMHVTLKFLGWVEARRLEQVHESVAAALTSAPMLRVCARGLGAFPGLRRPRVLWVGLEGEGLVPLAQLIEAAVHRLGFEPERRAFTPHITLGRVSGMRGWPRVEEVFKAHLSDDFGESLIDAVTIYRSTLYPQGAVYTPLWTIALRRNKEGPP